MCGEVYIPFFCCKGTVSVITHDLIRVPLIEEARSSVHQLETVKKKTAVFTKCTVDMSEGSSWNRGTPRRFARHMFPRRFWRQPCPWDRSHCDRRLPSQLLTWSLKDWCIIYLISDQLLIASAIPDTENLVGWTDTVNGVLIPTWQVWLFVVNNQGY